MTSRVIVGYGTMPTMHPVAPLGIFSADLYVENTQVEPITSITSPCPSPNLDALW